MIDAKNVKKYYGNTPVLNVDSFQAQKGEIIGFLGLNGAGKTTFMRILTSYLPATSGTIVIGGYDVAKESLKVRQKIGYLPEVPPLYPDMYVKDYLKFAACLKDVPAKKNSSQVSKAMDICNLNKVATRVIAHLSRGYKQRVGIAQAIINDPELLILDEPTNGLDPLQILDVRKLIKDLEYKRTVILSTHVLPEIEDLAQRVVMIKQGQLIKDQMLDADVSLEELFIKLNAGEKNG